MHYGLYYDGSSPTLECYSNANWASRKSDSKSTSGWIFSMGGDAVTWSSKKQTCIALSSMESEYIAMSLAGKEIV